MRFLMTIWASLVDLLCPTLCSLCYRARLAFAAVIGGGSVEMFGPWAIAPFLITALFFAGLKVLLHVGQSWR